MKVIFGTIIDFNTSSVNGSWQSSTRIGALLTAMTAPYTASLLRPTFYLRYYQPNAVNYTQIELTYEDFDYDLDPGMLYFPLNKKIRCTKIAELMAQGCNRFYIVFDNNFEDWIHTEMDPYARQVIALVNFRAEISVEVYVNTAYDVLETINQRHQQKYAVRDELQNYYEVNKKGPLWSYTAKTEEVSQPSTSSFSFSSW